MMIVTQEMLVEMYNEIQRLKGRIANLENKNDRFLSEIGKLNINMQKIDSILKDDFYVEVFKNV